MADADASPRMRADEGPRRTQINLRLTQGEKNRLALLSKATGETMTDYVLHRCVYEDQPIYVYDLKQLYAIRTELGHQGNNLNQIARALNAALADPENDSYSDLIAGALTSIASLQELNRAALGAIVNLACEISRAGASKRFL